ALAPRGRQQRLRLRRPVRQREDGGCRLRGRACRIRTDLPAVRRGHRDGAGARRALRVTDRQVWEVSMSEKFAIYVIVVEDTNDNAEEIGQLGASNIESIGEIESEQEAIRIAGVLYAEGVIERGE